jgi:hypothetical protein
MLFNTRTMPSLKDVLGYNDKISGHRLQRSISIHTLLETKFQIPNVNIKQTNIEMHSKVLVKFNILISVNAKFVSSKIENVYAGTKYKIIRSLTTKTSGMNWNSMNVKNTVYLHSAFTTTLAISKYIVQKHYLLNLFSCKGWSFQDRTLRNK